MSLVDCTFQKHGSQVRAIFNQAIRDTTAIYDYVERDEATIRAWFEQKAWAGHPVIGWEEEGRLAGFATYGVFRAKPAYKYTVEHSIYVHPDFHRRGIGRLLLDAIVARAEAADVRCIVGCIDAANQPSIALHLAAGFELSGVVREAGFKFGRWLDAAFYQRILRGPLSPCDG